MHSPPPGKVRGSQQELSLFSKPRGGSNVSIFVAHARFFIVPTWGGGAALE